MINVPFYANHDDNLHCMLAAYRSIFDYFLHKRLSWQELEAFTGFQSGRAPWSLKALTRMAAMGFDIRMIEPFDYRRYETEAEAYLHEAYGPEKAAWQLAHSNILDIRPLIPDFLHRVQHDCRRPVLQDIDDLLADGRLVTVSLNAKALGNEPGYAGHVVLVLGRDGDSYIAHDPGLPPVADRRISSEQLWQAMGAEHSTSEVTGFKLKARRNLRLDQYVVGQFPLLSRAYAVRLIDDGKVLVNGQTSKPGHKLREQDDITIDYDASQSPVIPDIDLPVLYEDDDCIVIDKPAGVLTHSVGKLSGEATVASYLRARLHGSMSKAVTAPAGGRQCIAAAQDGAAADGQLPSGNPAGQGDESATAENIQEPALRNGPLNAHSLRAGIVHRLDRATSGVIICAKTTRALAWLQQQFHDRQAVKTYAAIIAGHIEPAEAVIDMPIERNPKAPATFRVGANGKPAVTRYRVVRANGTYSLMELYPRTGRTHQLRVHLAQQQHPIVGDYLYGGEAADRLYLHAHSLEITLPNGQRRTFTAPLPVAFGHKMEPA